MAEHLFSWHLRGPSQIPGTTAESGGHPILWLSSCTPTNTLQNAPGDHLFLPAFPPCLPLCVSELLGQPEMTRLSVASHDWKLGLTEADT